MCTAIQGQSPDTCPPPSRRGVADVNRSIGDAGDRGGERPVPLPVSPSPAGRFPIDTVSGDLAVSSRSHLTPPKDPASTQSTVSGAIAKHLPAPYRGGGRRPRERAGRWGWLAYSQEKTFSVKCRRQGRGISRQPHPVGAIPHRYTTRECINHRVSVDPRQDPVSTPCGETQETGAVIA